MSPVSGSARARLDAVDLLRGLVMVLMALDHTRDFFHSAGFRRDPTDLATTTVALFLTRWVTHFCAPVFVLLAGTGAYLSRRPPRELARFLVTRGLWLMVLELTVVRFAWMFNLDYHFSVLQVIWALGGSMVVLGGLVFLPLGALVAFGAALVLGHDLVDGLHAERFGAAGGALWHIAHEPGMLGSGAHRVRVIYPLVPWVGVMALGYALGALISDEKRRRARLLRLGLALTAGFALLRASNLYGDPHPWIAQPSGAFTVLSFLNCEKYPPSLCYLLMTIGPALILLALARARGPLGRALVTFGRVPLFYYVAHLLLLHALAVAGAVLVAGRGVFAPDFQPPTHGLPAVYAVWLAAVVALYPACRWYAGVKRRSRSPLWSYL